jgi:putative ABC transport system substrate-binding protein
MMRRRDFITLLGGTATTWSLAARAQQPAVPLIGFLSSASPGPYAGRLRGFRQGLSDSGFVEGRNVEIEFRWADGQYDRMPMLAADLVRLKPAVIVASNGIDAPAAKAATTTIPIVFNAAIDPIASGLVSSLNRPGGQLTGVANLNGELGPKRLELLHELIPQATAIGLLVNSVNPATEALLRSMEMAARDLRLRLHVLRATGEGDFDGVFAELEREGTRGLVIGFDAFFTSRSERLAALTVRHAVPTIYQYREFAAAGGLMSYGGDQVGSFRQVGIYTGRILKGEKPADLPVQQAAKVELFINLKTAKVLGLTVPESLLARADEVIE